MGTAGCRWVAEKGAGGKLRPAARGIAGLPRAAVLVASDARLDVVADDGVDLSLPAAAAEDAVMADPRLHVVRLHVGAQPIAEILGGQRLADGADVVLLSLDRQQEGVADRLRVHR